MPLRCQYSTSLLSTIKLSGWLMQLISEQGGPNLFLDPHSKISIAQSIIFCTSSFPLDGKNKAVEVGAMVSLVPLLCDKDTDVRANAAGAIMVYVIKSLTRFKLL